MAPSLRTLLDEALLIGGTTFGQLLEIDGEQLDYRRDHRRRADWHPGRARRFGERRSCSRVGKPHYVPDVDADARYHRYLGEEMKSELAVPLISGETVLGVLNLESPAPGFFTAEHAQTLLALAGQAAVAVERARRFEVERLAAIGGLAGDIVHRLNNPVGALERMGRLAQAQGLLRRADREVSVRGAIRRAPRTRHQALEVDYPGTAGGAEAPRPCAGAAASGGRRGHPARLGLGDGGPVRVDAVLPGEPVYVLAGPSLPGIFWNLLDNAAKAMPTGGTLTIRGQRGPGPDRVTVEVEDEGTGIEPWRLASIFEPAASTTANSYAPTHGLGLWWTKGQVESFGGAIEVASEPGKGTRFTVRLRARVTGGHPFHAAESHSRHRRRPVLAGAPFGEHPCCRQRERPDHRNRRRRSKKAAPCWTGGTSTLCLWTCG